MENLDFGIEHVTEDCQCEGKWCSKCKSTKCFGAFHRNKKGKYGLAHECRFCVSERGRMNKDRQVEANRKWRKANPEKQKTLARKSKQAHASAYNEKTKLWHLANAERDRQWRQTHGKQMYENNQRWRKSNPEYMREHRRRQYLKRIARHTQAGGSYTIQEWEDIKAKYDYTCLCCGRREPEVKLTADHIIPVSRLGSSNIDNIQPLCPSCNSKKCDKTIDFRR